MTAGRAAADHAAANRALARYILLPTLLLTAALAGGVRVDAATRSLLFLPPPLVTLVLALLLLPLLVRGGLVVPRAWFCAALPPRANFAHALTLLALFFASAQAFNAVLPEAGLARWLFEFFFLWALWQQQFSRFDARRLLGGLSALFGTAFVLKHLLLASLYAPERGWLGRLAGALFEGLTPGAAGGSEAFAPATGYIAFLTLALYAAGLLLLSVTPGDLGAADAGRVSRSEPRLITSPAETAGPAGLTDISSRAGGGDQAG